ncbi:hypothetical protein GM658_14230 [Pseudoduganella eburnea]|uniref:Uncharacterized protein n=1 Tax=Massilia eburnea TaxID=1776165 RepID=A0A6L6QI16_9BURK|nr:hypothetical protein [Massilia eburnea]MTW11760.1 hypothetical protein [Massilia eburnea]
MQHLLRILALVVITVVAFVANAYAQDYWAGYLFPRVYPRPYLEMVSAAIVGAVVAAIVAALPLAMLFRTKAWLAGLFVALPVITLRTHEIVTSDNQTQQSVVDMAWVEMLSYTFLIVCAVLLVSHRMRKDSCAL